MNHQDPRMSRGALPCIFWWACVFFGRATSYKDPNQESLEPLQVSGNTNISMFDYSNGIEAMSGWTLSCHAEKTNGTGDCHFRFQNYSFEGEKIKEKACPVLLDLPKIYRKGYLPGETPSERRWTVDSRRFGPQTFLLHWREVDQNKNPPEFSVNFTIVNMQDCGLYPFQLSKVPAKILQGHVHHYLDNHNTLLMRDSVSIIYKFSDDLPLSQETFDSKGMRIQGSVGPEHFDISESAEIMIDNPYSDFNVDDRERFKVRYVCSSYPCKTKLHNGNMYALSTARDYLTSCEKREEKQDWLPPTWDCASPSLYSSEVTYPVQFDHRPNQIMIHNVYGAAFVAMVTEINEDYGLKVTLTMVAMGGRRYKAVTFHTLSGGFMHHGLLGHFFFNDNNDICFHLSWILGYSGERVFLIKCYQAPVLMKL